MRRVLAIALMAFFGGSPIVPGLLAGDDSNLPPCCRRHGKHHCAMTVAEMIAAMTPDRPQVAGVCDKYTHFQIVAGAAGVFGGALPGAGQAAFALAPEIGAVAAQPISLHRIAFGRSHQKRGPPRLSF